MPRRATPEEREQIAAALRKMFEAHQDHRKEQVGPCVWCADCNVRLYHGRLKGEA